ncbi:MAG: DoxX family protein [Pseudomonadota bacterium]
MALVAGAVELLGGLAIILGFKTRATAVIMILFTIVATLLAHPYWIDPTQKIQFYKNLAIIGGFLFVFVPRRRADQSRSTLAKADHARDPGGT